MDALYFDTFGECAIDNSDPTDAHSDYSSCSEAEDTPCPRCLKTRGKLCRKCKLRLRARDESIENTKSSLELVSSQNSDRSDAPTMGRHLESLGLSKLQMPRSLTSDTLPIEYEDPVEVNVRETSHYTMWSDRGCRYNRRYGNESWDHSRYHEWNHTNYTEWSYGERHEWNENGSVEWRYTKYEEWHQRDYTENWPIRHQYRPKRYREHSHFVRGRALQPCQIRSMKPGIDRDEPRYMAEIWQYTSRKRTSNSRLVLYGMQSCGILTLPYGTRVYARQRKLYLINPADFLLFILLKWSVRICRSLVVTAFQLLWYGKLPDPVPEELD
ncbi:hypothetical protein Daesc_009002 [Daldinia eschscholtzii]|uniref:Uncharacterized protein n=1 Tax=Daldinia eschscholtzii TaxID=292717 RepID=A0AAX6M8E7_9PEZI